jgi:helix-turn-helix protein
MRTFNNMFQSGTSYRGFVATLKTFHGGTLEHSRGIMNQKRNIVGPQIRKARERSHPRLTQQDLVARLEVRGVHIDRAGISKIETGYRVVTDVELLAFADALSVSTRWLLNLREEIA